MSYQVKPVGRTCAVTGRDFEPGSMCHSVLVHRDGKLVRIDYSPEGWDGPPDDAIGYWQCAVTLTLESERRKPPDPGTLMVLFEQLSESPNPAQEKLRYVLALLLMRKRRLTHEGTRTEDEVRSLSFSGTHGEGTFEVRGHDLDDQEIEELQKQLDAGAQNGWNAL